MKNAALIGFAAGILTFAAVIVIPPPSGLTTAGWHTVGLALLMAIWWSTEPVPIGVTALMPLIVMPLAQITDISGAASPYANPLVFLFLAGFLIAAAAKRWNLHKRLALTVLRAVGTDPRGLVLGLMVATAFLSMWITNTAAVILMLPIAMYIIGAVDAVEKDKTGAQHFAQSLLLGVAYSASIGGLGTLIGSPPNAILAGYLWRQHGIDLSFIIWSVVAIPLVFAFLPMAWVLLTRVTFPVSGIFGSELKHRRLVDEISDRISMTKAERRVGMVFIVAALLWAVRPLLNDVPGLEGLTDTGIGLICAALLFVIPSGSVDEPRFLLTWQDTRDVPWQVLILFGGGLSLAMAVDQTGLAGWIGQSLSRLGDLPPLLFLLIIAVTVVALTELASNTATVAAFLPVVGTIAGSSGADIVSVSAAVAMSASCAFMLPVATPPNALVFASGHVTVAAMMRAGVLMNFLSVVLVTIATQAFAGLVTSAQ